MKTIILLMFFVTQVAIAQAQGLNKWMGGNGLSYGKMGDGGITDNTSDNIPVIPDYRTGLINQWWADSNTTSGTSLATWQNTIDTLTARQSTAGDKPVHFANQLNGNGVVRFTSNDFFVLPTITLTNFTVIFAFKSRDNTDNYLLANANDGIWVSLTALAYGVGSFDGTRIRTANRTGLDTNWHIARLTNDKVYIDGVEKTYLSSQTLTGIVFDKFGGRTTSGFYFKGDIAVLRIYNAQLSNTNGIIVETKLNETLQIY